MSEIDFDTGEPIYRVEIYHNTPDTPGVWERVFNAENFDSMIAKAIGLFEADGLNPARITSIYHEELKTFGGGENGSR